MDGADSVRAEFIYDRHAPIAHPGFLYKPQMTERVIACPIPGHAHHLWNHEVPVARGITAEVYLRLINQ